MTVIEILLAIGTLVNLIKMAEITLRPHQQKQLQDKCETLALWLADTNPLDWYITHRVAAIIFRAGLFIFLIACFLVAFLYTFSWLVLIYGIGIFIVCLLDIMYQGAYFTPDSEYANTPLRLSHPLKTIQAISYKTTIPLAEWIRKSEGVGQVLLRTTVIAGLAVCLTFIAFAPVQLIDYPARLFFMIIPPLRYNDTLRLVFFIIYGVVYWTFSMLLLGVCFGPILLSLATLPLLIVSLLFVLTEVLVRIVRGIVWRIVEYNKGALAAMVLFVTIVLGVVELYLKRIAR